MKATELRIGNYVLQDEKFINGITSNSIHKFDLQLIKLEPIPITKEWFNKLGYYNENRPDHFVKDEMTIDEHTCWKCNVMFIDDKNGVRIKYVHQLQNLFFALKQRELTIKKQE
jgi:hypothetical protein